MSATTNFNLINNIDSDAICRDWMHEIEDQQTLQLCNNFMEHKKISLIFKKCIAELVLHRPSDPVEFLYRYFKKLQECKIKENISTKTKSDLLNKEDNDNSKNTNRTTKRESVYAESISEEEALKYKSNVIPKDFKSMRIILNAMQNMIRFSHLNDEEIVPAMDAVYSVNYSKGDHLIKAGEKRDRIFIVNEGEVEIYRDGNVIKVLHEGHFYDETSLIHPSISEVTLTAKTDVKIWTIDRYTYRLIVIGGRLKKIEYYKKFLKQIRPFEILNNESLMEIAEVVKTMKYEDGVIILNSNANCDDLFIIEKGTAIVLQKKSADINPTEICRLGQMDTFGHTHSNTIDMQDAVIVAKDLTTCITLSKDILQRFNIKI